jgi:hypothetical protein
MSQQDIARGKARGRRRALQTLAALAGATLRLASAKVAATPLAGSRSKEASGRRITQLIGANGWPGTPDDIAMWHNMGITWGRDSVGPGQPGSASDEMRVDRTGTRYDRDLAPVILSNNRNGIHSLLLLGYTPKWNASLADDTKSAPVDVEAWKRYVDAVVREYSAPPFNVRYFQIWNEAAGRLSGGLPQATFWHGPNFNTDKDRSGPYDHAMEDYVERIHIPAARIIRSYRAYVVYGGWPDQGGLESFNKWLEYRSPVVKERMLDWVDYIDTHYLAVHDLDPLYERYVKNGPALGIWQTEIGDRYMEDPHYLPRYFFDFAVWALERNWDEPNKYVSMIYHWDGYEPFRLTHRGPPKRTYNVSGKALIVLRQTVPGALARFSKPIIFGADASGSALLSDNDMVLQVSATPGWRTVSVTGIRPPSSRAEITFIDALTGASAPPSDAILAWNDQAMNIRFKVPDSVNGPAQKPPKHLAYIVVRSRG